MVDSPFTLQILAKTMKKRIQPYPTNKPENPIQNPTHFAAHFFYLFLFTIIILYYIYFRSRFATFERKKEHILIYCS